MSAETAPALSDKVSARAWAILAAMGFGALIAQMFSTVIGPALPAIRADLNLSLSDLTWTITSYSLAFGTALVAGGRMGDLVGEVKMIVIGFAIFGGGLVLAAVASNGGMLIAGRSIQGIGIGLSAPATLSIVVNSFPLTKRGMAIGTWGFAHGLGLLIGPLVGGYLTEFLSWNWVFWIAVPLTLAVIVVTLMSTRNYKGVLAKGTYDFVGLIFGGIAVTALTYGLQNSANGWGEPGTWGALIIGAVLFVIFMVVEMRIEHPLVDFGLWKERLFSGGFFAECACGFVYIPMLIFVGSFYFIYVLGFSPVKAGWVIIITTGTCMVLEPPAGRLVDRIGPGIPIAIGLGLQAVALFWFGTLTPSTTLAELIIPLALMGAGVGITLPACNTAGMTAVDAPRAGMGSGLMQMTFNIPAAFGVAVVTSLIGTISLGHVKSATADQSYTADAANYAQALQNGNDEQASSILDGAEFADIIKEATVSAHSSAIAISMIVLGVVAVIAFVMVLIVIGRRREPDHIEVTQALSI